MYLVSLHRFVSIDSDFLRLGPISSRSLRLQSIYNLLEDNVCTYRGVVKEFSVDDKGLVLVAGFGIPPHIGVSPPTRACQAALGTKKELNAIGVVCHIGISTGAVYAGSLGSETRREYAMVGDTVNLAARLMANSKRSVGELKENSRGEARRRALLREARLASNARLTSNARLNANAEASTNEGVVGAAEKEEEEGEEGEEDD